MFFSVSLSGGTGGTGPEAFPKETRVPFLFKILKLLSNLDVQIGAQPTELTETETYVSFPTPSNTASTPTPFVSSNAF